MQLAVRSRRRRLALLCPAFLLGCVFLVHPFAEIGMADDWSYVRTAQLFAQTGHIQYNGWATTMLGWQLLPAALAFRIFGASYLVARMTTLLFAAITAYLVERCFERCGIQPRNALLATIVLVTSPLFLPISISYMSDIYGLFAIVFCFYCCLRTVVARETEGMFWIAAAALGNALGGTARQIAWLGVLVMVPATLWLVRGKRRVLLSGVIASGLGMAIVAAALLWFHAKPYSVPETFGEVSISAAAVGAAAVNLLRLCLEAGFLLLPILVAFLPQLARTRKRLVVTGASIAAALVAALLLHSHQHHLAGFLVPNLQDGGNYVGVQGMYTAVPEHGSRPILLTPPLQVILTLLVLASFAAVAVAAGNKANTSAEHAERALRWHDLLVIIVPFSVSYVLLLTPRAAFFHPYDRYSLPLLVVGALLATRLYEERVHRDFPQICMVVAAAVGVYSVAVTHDTFALYRGTRKAVDELAAAGVPPTAIEAGWEYSGWTQITQDRFVHDPRLGLKVAAAATAPDSRVCKFELQYLFPAVHPQYALGLEPGLCGGRTSFPAVTFHTWLPWREQQIFVVQDAPEPH